MTNKPHIIKPKTTPKKVTPVTFQDGPSGKPEVKFQPFVVPHVIISSTAARKMQVYIEEMTDEIGWLGTTKREGNTITLTDVFLFRQEVHGTTTEITPEGLSEFGEQLLQEPNGMEVWNSLKLWGHSHVNMGITPSGQDDKQMVDFQDIGQDYFVRLIGNKRGAIGIDVYEYDKGFEFHNVPWTIEFSEDTELSEYQLRVLELENELHSAKQEFDNLQKVRVENIRKGIQDEIEEKVSKLTVKPFRPAGGYNTGYNSNYTNHYQEYYEFPKEVDEEFYSPIQTEVDFFDSRLDALEVIDPETLDSWAQFCSCREELLEEISFTELDGKLSNDDIILLWSIVREVQQKFYLNHIFTEES